MSGPVRGFTLVGSGLARKYMAYVVVTDSSKHSSLLQYGIIHV